MASIFTKIIQRALPAHILAEDEHHIAFLDIYPSLPGHTLVVPKQEVDYIFDLSDEALAALTSFAKKVGKGLEKAIPCKRIALLVIGTEVPHVHIHLLPIQKESDLNLCPPKKQASKETLTKVAQQVRDGLPLSLKN